MKNRNNFSQEEKNLVRRYESANNPSLFDEEEFEIIINFYLNENDFPAAKNALKLALNQHGENDFLLLKKAQILLGEDRAQEALNLIETLDKDEFEIRFWHATTLVQLGKENQACAMFDALVEESREEDDFDEVCFEIAISLRAGLEPSPKALKYLEIGHRFNPRNVDLTMLFAENLVMVGKEKSAEILLNSHLDLNPYVQEIWEQLAEIQLSTNPKEAEKSINFAILLDRKSPNAWKLKGQILTTLGGKNNFHLAIFCFEQMMKLSDSIEDKTIANVSIAEIFFTFLEQYELAVNHFQLALKLAQNQTFPIRREVVLAKTVSALCQISRFQEAENLVKRLTDEFPHAEETWVAYGDLMLSLENTPKAIEAFHKALQYTENRAFVLEILGRLYLKNDDFFVAYNAFLEAEKLKIEKNDIEFNLAVCCFELSRKNENYGEKFDWTSLTKEHLLASQKILPETKNLFLSLYPKEKKFINQILQ